MKVWEHKLEHIQKLIRKGMHGTAQQELGHLTGNRIPRRFRARIANHFRRVGMYDKAVNLLHPIIYQSGKKFILASDIEKAEYAACLTFIGAGEEALSLLREVNPTNYPQALLYQAFAHFSHWDYADAIPLLQRYLLSPKVQEYEQSVGMVNLAAALIYEARYTEAESLCYQVHKKIPKEENALLYGNTLELLAQINIFERNWNEAWECLAEAETKLSNVNSLHRFFIEKWKTVLKLLKLHGGGISLKQLHNFRAKALQLRHWETVRDCDRFETAVTKEEDLFLHLYFGTPFNGFRTKLVADTGIKDEFASSYLWKFGQYRNADPSLNVSSGQALPQNYILKPGQLQYRLLQILATDFYKPHRLAFIHFRLYPNECFNPLTSPRRVHEAVRRLKSWLSESAFPLTIKCSRGQYHLVSTGSCALQIELQVSYRNNYDPRFQLLKNQAESSLFSASLASHWLGTSKRTTIRWLNSQVAQGNLERSGRFALTRYRFLGE